MIHSGSYREEHFNRVLNMLKVNVNIVRRFFFIKDLFLRMHKIIRFICNCFQQRKYFA